MERRIGRFASLAGIIAAIALISVPAAGTSGISNGLIAYVRVNNAGPVPACSSPDCTAANRVESFIYVLNANPLTKFHTAPSPTRATLPNSFVVQSVEQRVFVDGVEYAAFSPATFTPPPNTSPFATWAGRWPATLSCAGDERPCHVVTSPAVLPGENTTVLFAGWIHGVDELNGTYIFKYTIHGTLNGTPVALRANSRPIEMTD